MAHLTITSPLAGTVVQASGAPGDSVRAGQSLVIIESMKMEHVVRADEPGTVESLTVGAGDSVVADQVLLTLSASVAVEHVVEEAQVPATAEGIRPDLQSVIDRHAFTLDENRPEAVARRRSRGQRTARENIADLCDDDTFVEYGALAYAAQRARRELDDLVRNTPADGLVAGVCSGIARRFGMSPWLVRVIFIASCFIPGPQFIIYIALWVLLPKD